MQLAVSLQRKEGGGVVGGGRGSASKVPWLAGCGGRGGGGVVRGWEGERLKSPLVRRLWRRGGGG